MKVEYILSKIRLAGLECQSTFTRDGPVVKVRIPASNNAICSLVPIDDDSDDRFIDFLIDKVKNYDNKSIHGTSP